MDLLDIITKYTSLITASIIFIIWLVRLEGKILHHKELIDTHDKSLAELKRKHEDLSNKVIDKLSDIEKTVARIEGFLQNHKDCK